jgi:hypothetical protein
MENSDEQKNTFAEKAIFKFNGGLGALLCSGCCVIIKTGKEFNESERIAFSGLGSLPQQFCTVCKRNLNIDNILPGETTN